MNSNRAFRYVWRINAILILLAAASISLMAGSVLVSEVGWSSARHRGRGAAPPVARTDSGDRLILGPVTRIAGTDSFRGELLAIDHSRPFSSSGYSSSETRNILFIDRGSKAARWLLPDRQHLFSQELHVEAHGGEPRSGRVVAEVVLAKPATADRDSDGGTLVLFDPTGRVVRTVAEGVRTVNHASQAVDGRITILFERSRKYVIASFIGSSLQKSEEYEISVPLLE